MSNSISNIERRIRSRMNQDQEIENFPIPLLNQVLLQSSYDDVVSYCKTNVRARVICNDNSFWMQKLDHDYAYLSDDATKPSQYVTLYDHPDTEGIDIYKRWEVTYKNAENMVKYGYNDNIVWLANMTHDGPKYFINHATSNGNMEILRWANRYRIYPDIMALDSAAANGHINVLDWFVPMHMFPGYWGAQAAAANNHLSVLEWFEKIGFPLDSYIANSAARYGHLNILYWLEQRGIFPTTFGANEAAGSGHLHILQWLKTKGILPDQTGANWAADADTMTYYNGSENKVSIQPDFVLCTI